MCAINITDKDISYAENILFGKTGIFDNERKIFIKNLETIDLQAIPGSGKTTALLAKLLILEKHLPFQDGSGILVLSHTNAAVDEIKERIGKFCPKLFSYPNFVGTIQSFVDYFLAIPFYVNEYKYRPYRIDDEIYNEKVEDYYNNIKNETLKNYLDKQRDGLSFLKSIRITPEIKLINGLNNTPDNFKLKNRNKPTYKALLKFKFNLIKEGYLHFDDAYFLANCYLIKYPQIKQLLQKRFKFVFVDEMQDIDKHQYDLLEKIFYDEGNSPTIYQRIGDKNQAIYSKEVKLEEIWEDREKTLYINGSHRLTPMIANVVEKLALTPNEIVGLNINYDGTEIDIKPHIIVYDDNSIKQVIPKFAKIIESLQDENKIPREPKHKFMAIGWRKDEEREVKDNKVKVKTGISSYWKDYRLVKQKKSIDHKVLKDYLLFGDDDRTLETISKNILNAFLKVMCLEDIKDENDRNYTKRKLLYYLKENKPNEYEIFKLKVYQWSIGIVKGKFDEVYASIKEYIPEFLNYFDKEINHSRDFINVNSEDKTGKIEVVEHPNKYKTDNIEIEVGTIHSAKGQTHTATLYFETFYHGKYESEYLANAILGEKFTPNGTYQKQATKMAYVGLSRPTHLLCIAIHKDRFDTVLEGIDDKIWEIVRL